MATSKSGSGSGKKAKDLESIKHLDKRANIPTEELRDFVASDELNPTNVLYPRDPSLDPQLVWKGKDEQDSTDLQVPVVPIYIQEKVHPQAIIDDLISFGETPPEEWTLFSDFNGGPKEFDKKIDFYHHEQNWTNRLVLGDSLLVMNSLSEKEGLKGKVQMVYLDPPYGIKFGSNWQVSTRKKDVKDNRADDATRQPEQIRAFRDTWKLGIHSYLTYLRDRLVVSRELLTESGSVFVQIGEQNVHVVRAIMDEVFGSDNFIREIVYQKTTGAGSPGELTSLPSVCDYIIWYAKDKERVKYRQLYKEKLFGGEGATGYTNVELPDGTRRSMTGAEREEPGLLPSGSRIFAYDNTRSQSGVDKTRYPVEINGKTYRPDPEVWKTHEEGMKKLISAGRISPGNTSLAYVRYLDDFPAIALNNVWTDAISRGMGDKVYVVQSTTKVIQRCLLMTTDPGDLVIDPTCGGGTTAIVAEQWGRRWITCDTSRVALALTRSRLMGARFPNYLLSDSLDGKNKEEELYGIPLDKSGIANDVRKGFVYKRIPHVTLKSIANNPYITEKMESKALAQAILRGSDAEILYDQAYEGSSSVRVCGPFSVESLSPHRVLSTSDENLNGTVTEREAKEQQDFASMILANLKSAGVQNSKSAERINFLALDPYPGVWINASGTYTDSQGKIRKVAISIGPEHGTVGPTQVKEAAKEAVQGVGFELLVVCGFAFDPHVAEESKRYGALTVLPAKINPDLAMGDELLKKTGTGNLFMVFGEPDAEITKHKDGKISVELRGIDIYDPSTGQVRSSSTDEIACWFVDTDYNGESFFVRHAYFTGADKPMEKLQKALKTDIDEEAWSSMYGTVSRPFKSPTNKKVAIKVINHYGDEVLKVFSIN
jgi:adenine-specific DNA-methyltransferase